MMKKLIYAAPFALVLALAGCNGSDSAANEEKEVAATETAEKEDKTKQSVQTIETVEDDEEGLTVDTPVADYGDITNVYFDSDVSASKKFSAVKVTINNIKLFDVKVSEGYENLMKYKQDTSHIVVLRFEAKNTTKRKIGFRPEQNSKLVINGKQSEPNYFEAPDDIMPKATAEYELYYEVKKPIDDVDKIEIYFEPAFDAETFNDLGEGTKWTLKLNK